MVLAPVEGMGEEMVLVEGMEEEMAQVAVIPGGLIEW